jgi:hypothetical protein
MTIEEHIDNELKEELAEAMSGDLNDIVDEVVQEETFHQDQEKEEESSWSWKTIAKYTAAAAVAVGGIYFVYKKCSNQVTEV